MIDKEVKYAAHLLFRDIFNKYSKKVDYSRIFTHLSYDEQIKIIEKYAEGREIALKDMTQDQIQIIIDFIEKREEPFLVGNKADYKEKKEKSELDCLSELLINARASYVKKGLDFTFDNLDKDEQIKVIKKCAYENNIDLTKYSSITIEKFIEKYEWIEDIAYLFKD